MSGGNGKTVIAIVLVVALLGAFYLWYTGGSLGSLGGGAQYQSASGIAPMGGGGGGGKSSSTDYGGMLMPLLLGGGVLGGLGTGYYFLQGRTLTLSASEPEIRKRRNTRPPIPADSKTIITAQLKFNRWRKPSKQKIEFRLYWNHPPDTLLDPLEAFTDDNGKATTTLTAGTDEGTATIFADYKAVFGKYVKKADTDVEIVDNPAPPTPPTATIDEVKEHIKQKIAEKAIAQLGLILQVGRDQFINCLFRPGGPFDTSPPAQPWPDRVIAELKPAPFADDTAILTAFSARATDPAFGNALSAVLDSRHILGAQIEKLISAKSTEITRCNQGGGSPNMSINPYDALSNNTVLETYGQFNQKLKHDLKTKVLNQKGRYALWTLFDIFDFKASRTMVGLNYEEIEKMHPLLRKSIIAGAFNVTVQNQIHSRADVGDEAVWEALTARSLLSFYIKGEGAREKKVTDRLHNIAAMEIPAGTRSETVAGKLKLIGSFFQNLAPKQKNTFDTLDYKAFSKRWDDNNYNYKQFFIDYDAIIRNEYLLEGMDYPPKSTVEHLSKGADKKKFKYRSYLVYCTIVDFFEKGQRLDTLKNVRKTQIKLEDELRTINNRLIQDYDKVTKAEQTSDFQNMDKYKERLYEDLCGKNNNPPTVGGMIGNAWATTNELMADANTQTLDPPKIGEIKSLAENNTYIRELLDHNTIDQTDIEATVNATRVILSATSAISLTSATALKLYLYIAAKFALSLKKP